MTNVLWKSIWKPVRRINLKQRLCLESLILTTSFARIYCTLRVENIILRLANKWFSLYFGDGSIWFILKEYLKMGFTLCFNNRRIRSIIFLTNGKKRSSMCDIIVTLWLNFHNNLFKNFCWHEPKNLCSRTRIAPWTKAFSSKI